jgi:hypothetical protein
MPITRQNLTEPVCGKCRYCVRGITSLVCPECGSDLREVGIIAPNAALPLPNYAKAIFWTLFLPIPAFLLSWLMLVTILPYSVTRKVHRMIFCQQSYMNVTLQVFGTERLPAPALASQVPPPFDEITIYDPASQNSMVVHLSTGAYTSLKINRLVQQPSGFNSSAIVQWVSGGLINGSDPRVKQMCDGVYGAVVEMQTGNAGNFTRILDLAGNQIGVAHPATAWVVHDEPHPAIIAGLCALWLAVWLYGIWRVYARRKTGTAEVLV